MGGVQIAGPITNSAVAVSNGLFTVTLDFGPGVFTGTNYWVLMAVSPAGAGTFTQLVPRQQLTPTPYALSAANGTWAPGISMAGPSQSSSSTGLVVIIQNVLPAAIAAVPSLLWPSGMTSWAVCAELLTEHLGQEADLFARCENDAVKLEIAARLRRETTLWTKAIAARMHLGSSKAANRSLHSDRRGDSAATAGHWQLGI